ncbi:hypothetical protein TRV_08009, partial [Trichophyton verrucosum HKI 0517]
SNPFFACKREEFPVIDTRWYGERWVLPFTSNFRKSMEGGIGAAFVPTFAYSTMSLGKREDLSNIVGIDIAVELGRLAFVNVELGLDHLFQYHEACRG